ncbi:MAG: DUF1553 domain-containing protein [Planctomycetota bacterium]
MNRLLVALSGVLLFVTSGTGSSAADDVRVEFNRDIRPILSDNCFACHGPDEKTRQAGLRFDIAEHAKTKLASGVTALVPGKIGESELARRIVAVDPNQQMPPVESGKRLTARQIELLQRWIEQGAEYQPHWSFVTPKRPVIPHSSPHSPSAEPGTSLGERRLHWPLNPIDNFVLDRLEREGLAPSPPAEKERLIRRVTLDLTGVPPTLGEVDEFLADASADAYDRLVDRLFASPRYGERMTLDWLDAARYADTHGFNNDTTRYMWRWRDWTINAFNSGMPFDQFVTEQLAGDLLPNPTLDQRLATGFNRNHVINSEGGIIPEEYRVEYVADRVHTTATILLGLSMGCARCHDHKFDPLTQREYYQFFAFFNQLNEQGEAGRVGNAEPTIKAPTPEQIVRRAALSQQLASLDDTLKQRITRATETMSEWEPKLRAAASSNGAAPAPFLHWTLNETTGSELTEQRDPTRKGQVVGKAEWTTGKLDGALKFDGSTHVEAGDLANFDRTDKFSYGAWVNVADKEAATVLSRMDDATAFRGYDLLLVSGKLTAHLVYRWPDEALHVVSKVEVPVGKWTHVFATYDGSSKAEGFKLYIDGKRVDVEITNNLLTASPKTTKPLRIGRRTNGAPFRGLIDEVRLYDRELTAEEVSAVSESDSLRDLLAIAPDKRTPEQTLIIVKAHLTRSDADYQRLVKERADTDKLRSDLEKAFPSAMVMLEMPSPRKTFVLKRGQYDAPADEVQPDVPASLPPFPKDAPRNRLGLAQWLLAPEHPLTSRVAVNRAWTTFFGTGLVETVEDFGSQGQWPSHLELIDWLAVEFGKQSRDESRETRARTEGESPTAASSSRLSSLNSRLPWDTKHLHRLIVTSATYRQSSRVTKELQERDPANKLLARGPRFRMQAETIRDNALAVAGLLSDHFGGPSVSPYQPANLWDDVAVGADYEGTVYKQDKGEGLYRRSMYTFWKRTCPPPGLNTFDAPEREVCTSRRSRTNTPLQALVLMNDPTYLEAARKLAERAMTEGGESPAARLTFAFRLAVSRAPTPAEIAVLLKTLQQRLTKYQQDPAAAKALLSHGDSPRNESLNEPDLAAWAAVMSLILNLDEAITKG